MNLSNSKQSPRGFTLVEMALATALTLGIAIATITVVQQQLSISSTINQFNFLRDDAPQINVLLTNLISQADDYSIHTTTANAKAGTAAVINNGRALRLRFRLPDGTTNFAIISFETVSGERQLSFYNKRSTQQSWPVLPNWVVSSKPDTVNFSNAAGILEITLVGKYGEEFTFAGNPT